MESSCKLERSFIGVSVDSRLHRPENLFFALPGERTDGHHFLEEISHLGAAAAVVRKDYKDSSYGLSLIYVDDPLLALQNLAKAVLGQSQMRVIGVTGSVGKTTTKDFITTLLKEKFHLASSPGNSNSQVGLPLTILNHTLGDEEILVLEMGMTHKGQINTLVNISQPECVLITSVALVHACNFESLEEIAWAKGEILAHPKTKLGIIHRDLIDYENISKIGLCKKISFSYDHPLADYTICSNHCDTLAINFHNHRMELGRFPIVGKHHQTNFLAALACAHYFGLSWQEISKGMSQLSLPHLRGEHIEKEGIIFINDSYNAAEISLKAALENIPQPQSGGRKVAVLADMLELGKFSQKAHSAIGNYSLDFVDLMFCYGQECRHIAECWQKANRPVQWFLNNKELLSALKKNLKKNDVVLIKGSRGMQLYNLLNEWEQ